MKTVEFYEVHFSTTERESAVRACFADVGAAKALAGRKLGWFGSTGFVSGRTIHIHESLDEYDAGLSERAKVEAEIEALQARLDALPKER